jgi:hypothetical protein
MSRSTVAYSDSANTAWADVVFTAEVLLVAEQPDADRSFASLRVLSRLKGSTPDTVRVQTGLRRWRRAAAEARNVRRQPEKGRPTHVQSDTVSDVQ